MTFHALGTPDLYEVGGLNTSPDDIRNLGRAMLTGLEEDYFKFKVPQLYNLQDYATFFHGSSKNSIEEVVEYKLKATSENPMVQDSILSNFFHPVELIDIEKTQLIDFLRNGLYDANLERYVPESLPSGNCFPNNDALSRYELGCE
jgi:cytochrome c peroxidase